MKQNLGPTGLLWLIDPALGLEENIKEAARRFAKKFGMAAGICFVHPGTELPESGKYGRIALQHDTTVLRQHLRLEEKDTCRQQTSRSSSSSAS